MDINVKLDDYILNCRACAIIIKNDKVLLQKRIKDRVWALPGGKIKIGEKASFTISRELNEELNSDRFSILRINSVTEHFFSFAGVKYHQYIFSFLIDLYDDEIISKDEFYVDDLVYKWFLFEDIDDVLIKPDFVKDEVRTILDKVSFITWDC